MTNWAKPKIGIKIYQIWQRCFAKYSEGIQFTTYFYVCLPYLNTIVFDFILGLLIWRVSWPAKWGGPWPGPKSLNPKDFISWKGSLVTGGGWGGLENSCLIGLTGLGGRVGGKWSDAAKSSRIYWSWPCSWTWWWWETSSWKSSKVSKRSGASKSSASKVGNCR